MKKRELVRHLRSERASLEILLAEIGEERMETPGVDGLYSVKDLIGHLWTYEAWTADWLAAARKGELLPPGPMNDPDSDRRNDALYPQDRDLAEALDKLWQDFERLIAEIEQFSDADLEDPQQVAWFTRPFFEGAPALWECILLKTSGHYKTHVAALEAWANHR